MAAAMVFSEFGTQENKISQCFYFSPLCLPLSDGTGCHYLSFVFFFFLMLSFKPAFSLPSFTLIKRLFSSSSPSVIKMVSSAYLRLLIIIPAILILSCDSSTPAFCMMCSTYKLKKLDDNIQPCHTPFSMLNQSVVPCKILTVLNSHKGSSGDI